MRGAIQRRRLLPRAVLAAILLALPAAADAPRDQYQPFDGDTVTIRDKYTKLEWDRRSVLTNVTFANAEAGCSVLATLQSVGRLPTIKELLTVLDEEPHDAYEFGMVLVKHIDRDAFADTPVDLTYWSSTAAGPNEVWGLSFSTGFMTKLSTNANTKAHARCVR